MKKEIESIIYKTVCKNNFNLTKDDVIRTIQQNHDWVKEEILSTIDELIEKNKILFEADEELDSIPTLFLLKEQHELWFSSR